MGRLYILQSCSFTHLKITNIHFLRHFNIHIPALPMGHKPAQGAEDVPQIVTTYIFFSLSKHPSLCYKLCFTLWTTLHHIWQPNPPWTLWAFVVKGNRHPDINPSPKHISVTHILKTYKYTTCTILYIATLLECNTQPPPCLKPITPGVYR